MDIQLPIRSRAGNYVLLIAGFAFVISATAILIFAIQSTWGFAGPIDHMLQILLLGCAAVGVYLAVGARRNLGHTPAPRLRDRRV